MLIRLRRFLVVYLSRVHTSNATVTLAGYAGAADDDVIASSRDVSLGEEGSRHDPGESSDDVTAPYPAEVIVEGQQMNKVWDVNKRTTLPAM